MKPPLIADTGGLLRALAAAPGGRPAWPEFAGVLRAASAVIVPALILAEVDWFLRDDRRAMRNLVADIFDPATTYEFEPSLPADIVRALEIDGRFKELELRLVDGLVAAVAERRGVLRVLTIDRRDLGVVRIGPRFDRPLVLVP